MRIGDPSLLFQKLAGAQAQSCLCKEAILHGSRICNTPQATSLPSAPDPLVQHTQTPFLHTRVLIHAFNTYLDLRVGVTDSAAVVGDHIGHATLAELQLADLRECRQMLHTKIFIRRNTRT